MISVAITGSRELRAGSGQQGQLADGGPGFQFRERFLPVAEFIHGGLAGAVVSVVINPLVGKIVEGAGSAIAERFSQVIAEET